MPASNDIREAPLGFGEPPQLAVEYDEKALRHFERVVPQIQGVPSAGRSRSLRNVRTPHPVSLNPNGVTSPAPPDLAVLMRALVQ